MVFSRIKIIAVFILSIVFFPTLIVLAATIGSDTAPTRFNTFQTLNNGDRIAGFSAIYGGFGLADVNTIGTFDSFFQVCGPLDLNYGTLVLNQDLILNNNVYLETMGHIVGQGHVLELSCSMTAIPTTPSTQEICAMYLATQATTNSAKSINTLDWSVGDNFIALGLTTGAPDLEIWQWNGSNALTFKTAFNVNGRAVNSVSWHPTQSWLAVGTASGTGAEIFIYSVNVNTGALTLLSSTNYGANVTSLEWHPGGSYLAVGGAAAGRHVAVYPVNGSGVLGTVVNFNAASTPSNNDAVAWDSTGNYLAVGFVLSANPEVRVFRFVASPISLTQVTSITVATAALSVDWNPTYTSLLAVGFQAPVAAPVQLYTIDVNLGTATLLSQISTVYNSAQSVHWNSSGSCLAVGTASPNVNTIQIYSFLNSSYAFVLSNAFGSVNTLTLRWSRVTGSMATGGTSTVFIYRSIFGSSTLNTTDPNGPGASGQYFKWNNICLVLNGDIVLNDSCILLSGDSTIDGRGHTLMLSPGSRLFLDQASTLEMKDITIGGLQNNVLGAFDNASTFSLSSVSWVLDANYTMTKGRFDVIDDFVISGSGYTFSYQTQGLSTIYDSGGNLIVDRGVVLSYEPASANRNLINLVGQNALLTLHGATLHATSTGLQLTKGTVVVDETSYLIADGSNVYQAISFGDGINSNNNVNLEVTSAVSLNVLSGCVVYNNV